MAGRAAGSTARRRRAPWSAARRSARAAPRRPLVAEPAGPIANRGWPGGRSYDGAGAAAGPSVATVVPGPVATVTPVPVPRAAASTAVLATSPPLATAASPTSTPLSATTAPAIPTGANNPAAQDALLLASVVPTPALALRKVDAPPPAVPPAAPAPNGGSGDHRRRPPRSGQDRRAARPGARSREPSGQARPSLPSSPPHGKDRDSPGQVEVRCRGSGAPRRAERPRVGTDRRARRFRAVGTWSVVAARPRRSQQVRRLVACPTVNAFLPRGAQPLARPGARP